MIAVAVAVGVSVGVGVLVGVTVGVDVNVAVGVLVGVGVSVGVIVGVGVGNSSILALKECIFPQETPQLAERVRGPSLAMNSFFRKSHPHEGKEHRLRL